MKISFIKVTNTWRDVADAARTTIGKDAGEGEPSSNWKRRMLLAEHSPIRKIHVNWKWVDLLWWVQTHFTRHKFGVEWFVQTSRTDRTGIDRNTLSQSSLVNVEGQANAQAIINISRKRLCSKASPETRQAWIVFLNSLKELEPELVSICVPDCVYRGWCYEYDSCKFHLTDGYQMILKTYRFNINEK